MDVVIWDTQDNNVLKVAGDCSYPGVPGAVQNYVQHPGGGLVQPQQAYPYPQVQNEYTYLNTVGKRLSIGK